MHTFTDRTWLWLAAAFYLAGFVLGGVSLLRGRRHPGALMYGIIACGFVLQTIGLHARGIAVGSCPIGNLFEIVQFTAWSAIVLYLVVGAAFRLSILGSLAATLATALTLLSLAIPAWDATRRAGAFGGSRWIEFHAALALFSYGVFGLLALTSIMWLLQFFSLKQHRLRGVFSILPSIIELDRINLRLLAAGVVLLVAALAVGSVHWLGDTSAVKPLKLAVAAAVCAAYTAALALRLAGRLITKRLAWTCVLLFAAAMLSLWAVDSSRRPARATSPQSSGTGILSVGSSNTGCQPVGSGGTGDSPVRFGCHARHNRDGAIPNAPAPGSAGVPPADNARHRPKNTGGSPVRPDIRAVHGTETRSASAA
jgi:ABC-type uncharacterized transport system permease subunit